MLMSILSGTHSKLCASLPDLNAPRLTLFLYSVVLYPSFSFLCCILIEVENMTPNVLSNDKFDF